MERGEGKCGEKYNSDLKAGCSIAAQRVAITRHPLHSYLLLPKEHPPTYRAALLGFIIPSHIGL